ncbi:L,D-transpeptidase [Methylobacterium mesophilicum]
MSKLIYHGGEHRVEVIGKDGKSLGKWIAYNDIDSKFAKDHYGNNRHLDNGYYTVSDKTKPYAHKPDANGPYGLHGIIRFNYPGHPGVGLHSGRANAENMPGAQHATHGCIRTTDEAMAEIIKVIANDPLITISVKGNNSHSAHKGKHKHHLHHRNLHKPSGHSDAHSSHAQTKSGHASRH